MLLKAEHVPQVLWLCRHCLHRSKPFTVKPCLPIAGDRFVFLSIQRGTRNIYECHTLLVGGMLVYHKHAERLSECLRSCRAASEADKGGAHVTEIRSSMMHRQVQGCSLGLERLGLGSRVS